MDKDKYSSVVQLHNHKIIAILISETIENDSKFLLKERSARKKIFVITSLVNINQYICIYILLNCFEGTWL